MALNVIILAGGSGTRMASNQPKVLHQLGGKFLLDHVLDAVVPLKPARIFVVYGYQGSLVLKAMQHRKEAITWVEQEQRLGTGHAVQQVLPYLDHPGDQALILCGDAPLINSETLAHLVNTTHQNQVGIVAAEVPVPYGFGRIVRNEYNQVVGIVEEKDASDFEKCITEINAGIYCLPVSFLQKYLLQLSNDNAQKEYYLTEMVSFCAEEQMPITVTRPWEIEEIYGINTRAELARLERIYQLWQAQALMRAGVTLYDPERVDIRGKVIPAQDCVLDVNVILAGQVELAECCYIGPNCYLENVRLGKNTVIKANSVIQDAVIGADCQVGPFARIRPGTVLHDQVHVGNFVEVKNTVIGSASKANHLSYLGDASIGKQVNIGAGVITCNYDGVNKHRTEIEDEAFIGSDAQLIAPIKVGKGATVGAGTTLTKDAPAQQLTVGRARQQTIEGWVRPVKRVRG